MNEEVNNILSALIHDLRNDFVIIRAATSAIKKNLSASDIVEKKIAVINLALDQANSRLESSKASLQLSSKKINVEI